MSPVTVRKMETSYHAYEIEFTNGLVVTIQRAGPIWESWCCGIGFTHVFEDSAVQWAFELARWPT